MGRPTDTNDIRTYCLNHISGVFDTNYLSKHLFDAVPVANFRKYVTRFEKEGLLRKISKGLFMIGDSELDDEERITRHYLNDGLCTSGLVGGADLLNELGLSMIKGKTIIYSNKAVGIKHLNELNIDIIESHANYGFPFGGRDINIVLELLNCRNYIIVDEELDYHNKIRELLAKYNDDQLTSFVDFNLYPRHIFLSLANILESMHISNRVMEIYAHKIRNSIS